MAVDDPLWFQRAVLYEVMVRGYADSDGDGIGDLNGLTSKLDHLQRLGVDCLWLLPFYGSPLRDGGYDIADFYTVHPDMGTLADAVRLFDEAHRRGMRIITDLVVNHTSDQHPWFQESRQDRSNPKADWYVWGDDDQRWSEARIIFHDTEESNWTWDEQRGQFFWHRFFHHQPDLNYRNPKVQQAIIDVMTFWLALGLDGFRLDAVPYLFEADGTNGENLPETHQFLRRLRHELGRAYPDRILLAEANQWPRDVVEYFGAGDECHLCFHFPLMPRLYLAAKRGDAQPIRWVLDETPAIPAGTAWATFLRNHDELTLEMVSDAERDEMYACYAPEPRMRSNTGIRRRLAPLLGGHRPLIELFHVLLCSLPGSPVLYYGDEIGMGDTIALADRDGVRTPMQWSAERNGGFSTADPERLYLPAITDPVYGYQVVNVEAHERDPGSLLNWLRALLATRRAWPQLSTGAFELFDSTSTAVLAYLRHQVRGGPHPVLCVANLAATEQVTELALSGWQGRVPHDVISGAMLPVVTEAPYEVTLAPHGWQWFELRPEPSGSD